MTDYLSWTSELTLETVFAGTESVSYPQLFHSGVLYISSLPDEQGRVVVKYRELDDLSPKADADEQSTPNETICITPQPFNLRTKISEYGGKPFLLHGNTLYFANNSDQCLYRQELDPLKLSASVAGLRGDRLRGDTADDSSVQDPSESTPDLVTIYSDNEDLYMYTDVLQVQAERLIAIAEMQASAASENRAAIIYIEDSAEQTPQVITTLVSGADFYSNLVYHQATSKVAWVQWNHPNMPWDETELWVADLVSDETGIRLENSRKIELELGPSVQTTQVELSMQSPSICQLCFANNGRLFFSSDFANQEVEASENFWNIYVVDPSSNSTQDDRLETMPVSSKLLDREASLLAVNHLEFGYPHWQYGDIRIVQLDENNLLAIGSSPIGDVLLKIDQNTLATELLPETSRFYQNLSSDGNGRAAAVLLSDKLPPSLAVLEPQLRDSRSGFCSGFHYIDPPGSLLAKHDISHPEHIQFAARDGGTAYAFYYPPRNANFAASEGQLPPLIVMVHGGPTARAYGYFDIQKQYWTQRGFALMDVNHRGSSGYGRAYRDALYTRWGEIDTSDIIDGIEYLIEQGKVDASRVCIRGKSAGGYAVLAALTQYPHVFSVGACYYGIGNLLTLAATTHKFEKYYTNRLIGEEYHPQLSNKAGSLFTQRSPIHQLAELQSAMIVFQGSQDKVVPPKVAHEIVDVLDKLGLNHMYVEYPEEAHGFRQLDNNIDALTKELEFYRANLK